MGSGRFKFDRRRHEDLIPMSVAVSDHEFPQGNLKPVLTVNPFAAPMSPSTTSVPPLTLTALANEPAGPRHKCHGPGADPFIPSASPHPRPAIRASIGAARGDLKSKISAGWELRVDTRKKFHCPTLDSGWLWRERHTFRTPNKRAISPSPWPGLVCGHPPFRIGRKDKPEHDEFVGLAAPHHAALQSGDAGARRWQAQLLRCTGNPA
jgi:hypothetical protein